MSRGAGGVEWGLAACLGMDASLFFADGPEEGNAADSYREGRAVCHWCPIRDGCLEFALRTHEHHGLWGGKSPTERRQIKRPRQRRVS